MPSNKLLRWNCDLFVWGQDFDGTDGCWAHVEALKFDVGAGVQSVMDDH